MLSGLLLLCGSGSIEDAEVGGSETLAVIAAGGFRARDFNGSGPEKFAAIGVLWMFRIMSAIRLERVPMHLGNQRHSKISLRIPALVFL